MMTTMLRPGLRLRSAVCDSEIVVVRAPSTPVELRCGGHAMLPVPGDVAPEPRLELKEAGGTLLGKRYEDERTGLEVLCTKAGSGGLTVDGEALHIKAAKPLPSSD